MSILNAIRQQTGSLDELAKLPQSEIMKMAQHKQIPAEMVAPILSRKSEMMDASIRTRQASVGAQPAPPTVVEGLMAKNAQSEAPQIHETGIAQLPIPERQYAGGGIIAFSGGDFVNEDDDPEEERLYQQAMNTALANSDYLHEQIGSRGMPQEMPRREVNAVPSATPKEVTREQVTHKIQPASGNHPYKEMVAKDAVKYGVDPSISTRILMNETGGLKNPETAKSKAGAVGIAQFMPATAKQYGIDPTNPEQASDAMNRHVHHLMKEYGDPQLVAIAYNWGEGNTNKWLAKGADPDRLPKETQAYLHKFMYKAMAQGGQVDGYAQGGSIKSKSYEDHMKSTFGYHPRLGPTAVHYLSGGEVQHYAVGDYVDGDPMGTGAAEIAGAGSPTGRSMMEIITNEPEWKTKERIKREQESSKKKAPAAPASAQSAPPVLPPRSNYEQTSEEEDQMFAGEIPRTAPTPTGKPLPAPQTKENAYERFLRKQEEMMDKSEKQRESDKNMALIAAGLGILGGESPYAAVNIGKGALHGVQYMSEADRHRAAAQNAGMVNIGRVLHYKDLGDIAEQDRQLKKEAGEATREERARTNRSAEETRLQQSIGNLEKIRLASAQARATKAQATALDPDKGAAEAERIMAEARNELYSSPDYKRLWKKANPDLELPQIEMPKKVPSGPGWKH